MPLFTPGRRWQPPFRPFKKESTKRRIIASIEKAVKGPLFGCRMCGNCMLQETALICPMECSKGVRNGPCGGSTEKGCYVDPSRPCIWYKIYERAFKLGREELLLEVLPPLDWNKTGTEAWEDGIVQLKKIGTKFFFSNFFSFNPDRRALAWNSLFQPIRQPDWWQGDTEYHPPAYDEPISQLEKQLKSGKFVVTTEVTPPASTATGKLKRDIEAIKPYAAAINFTDCPAATPRMSSEACSRFALDLGAEPIMQIAARDINRTGLQSKVIGTSSAGIRNLLCITGDSARLGPQPIGRMDILDIDSVQMLWILRRMRDDGIYLGGREIKFPPKLFLGAAASPCASEAKYQAIREHKKINAGAQFLQTNLIYDIDSLEIWLNELAKRNILDKIYILIGIAPIKNLKIAYYLDCEVPGVHIPDHIMKRLENAGDNAGEESINITLELIEKIRSLQGINGIHLMPLNWEEIVPQIISQAGLLDQ